VTDDLDACHCGDYRRDHVDGKGRCKLNWAHSIGEGPCSEFRLFRTAAEIFTPENAIAPPQAKT
jgi:hypothetical protein